MKLLPLWLRQWPRPRCAPARRDPSRARLRIEPLEDRLMPSAGSLTDPASYALWRQQQFRIDDTNLGQSTAAPAANASTASAASNASFGSFIGLDQAFASTSYRGDGYSVAVIDTGIDYNNPDLGGGWGKRVIAGWNFVNNTADPMDDNGHGTFVAGEIASSSATYSGVAPDANLIALKVLDSNGSGSYGNVKDALDWVIAHQAQYHIVSINLSLGSGNYTTNPYTYLESDFATLKADGVFIAVAAGNDYYADGSVAGLAYPAVSSNVVSVGAVWDGNFGAVSWVSGARDYMTFSDKIASFSQRGSALSLFAPGAIITGEARGGGTTTMAGTSMATPVVAGAAVLLHQALDAHGLSANANQDYILQLMQSTGKLLVDGNYGADNVSHTGLSFRRLDLGAALSALGPVGGAPTIAPIADQTAAAGKPVTVAVSTSGAGGLPVTWSASAMTPAQDVAAARARLGLWGLYGYLANYWGMNEQWLWSSYYGGIAVCILPDGTLRHWDSAGPAAMLRQDHLVGRVDPSYYANPTLLNSAPPGGGASPATVSVSGTQVTVTPSAGYTGPVYVEVVATDGAYSSRETFIVNVTNDAPVIASVPDQSVRPGQSAAVTVSATDGQGALLNWQASAMTPAQDAYAVQQRLKLATPASMLYNMFGLGEKWLWSYTFGGLAVCILPDGTVRRYNAGGAAAVLQDAQLLGRVDPMYYANPLLLTGMTAPPTTPPATIWIYGSQLYVTPNPGYTGPIYVELAASNGSQTVRKTFIIVVV